MVPRVSFLGFKDLSGKDNRVKTQEVLDRHNKAQEDLEKICLEKEIHVPVMVC